MDQEELKKFILAIIDEEFGPNPAPIAKKWLGGTMILKPGGEGQEKDIPLDVFFKKITMIRENLRVLEQKINSQEGLDAMDKATFQSYITKCYGTLTTFNILFREDKDKFVGAGKEKDGDEPSGKMTVGEAKRRLGLNEY